MLALLELVLIIVIMTRIADAESRSPWIWGSITLVFCLVSIAFIPLVFIAPIIGGVLAFVAMLVTNAVQRGS